jgi:hypothetical protein
MIIVKVTYTVKPEFVQKNLENIELFMVDFKAMNTSEFRYVSYLCADGRTFVHLSHYENPEIQQRLLETPSFLSFQQQRDNSGLERSPQIDIMHVVETSHPIF